MSGRSLKPQVVEWVEELGPGRRETPRLYFHDGETPFDRQSSGLPAQLLTPGFFRDHLLGRIIVKDISLGGAGFLAPVRLLVPKRILIQFDDVTLLAGDVLHRRPIEPLLCFYGVRWFQCKPQQIESVMRRWDLGDPVAVSD